MSIPIQTDPPIRLLAAFHQHYPSQFPERILQVPGRELWVAAAVNETNQFAIATPDLDAHTVFTHQSAKLKRTVTSRPLPRWARYPAGVILLLSNCGIDIGGVMAVVAGDEPLGPRYEYALGIAVGALWHDIHDLTCSPETLIEIVDRARRDYVDML